jgi:DNA-binding NtrC family response regulator
VPWRRRGAILDDRQKRMAKLLETGDFATMPKAECRDISHQREISPRLRVLVVDDEPLIRWSLTETLEQAGHTVAEAADAVSASRSVAGNGPFDVVVLDYRLPDSNDLNLLRTIRNGSPAPAVVMMTAFGAPEIAASALALGAYCIVPKPFEVGHMAALVMQAHEADDASSPRDRKSMGGSR